MRSAQRQMELRRLGNQFPRLGKANSLCEAGNISLQSGTTSKMLCVLPVCFKLRLSPGRVHRAWDKDISGYRSSGKIRVASRRCTTVPVMPLAVKNDTNSRSFVCSVPLFRSLMLTPMVY